MSKSLLKFISSINFVENFILEFIPPLTLSATIVAVEVVAPVAEVSGVGAAVMVVVPLDETVVIIENLSLTAGKVVITAVKSVITGIASTALNG